MADEKLTTDEILKSELLRLDVQLRRKQSFWETRRAILLIIATTAALFTVAGWWIGSAPPREIIVHVDHELPH